MLCSIGDGAAGRREARERDGRAAASHHPATPGVEVEDVPHGVTQRVAVLVDQRGIAEYDPHFRLIAEDALDGRELVVSPEVVLVAERDDVPRRESDRTLEAGRRA